MGYDQPYLQLFLSSLILVILSSLVIALSYHILSPSSSLYVLILLPIGFFLSLFPSFSSSFFFSAIEAMRSVFTTRLGQNIDGDGVGRAAVERVPQGDLLVPHCSPLGILHTLTVITYANDRDLSRLGRRKRSSSSHSRRGRDINAVCSGRGGSDRQAGTAVEMKD